MNSTTESTPKYGPDDLLTPAELAPLLRRTPSGVQVDASRRPKTLPPRFQPPGTRAVLYRYKDILEWMDEQVKPSQPEPKKRGGRGRA